jgi:cysteine synthase
MALIRVRVAFHRRRIMSLLLKRSPCNEGRAQVAATSPFATSPAIKNSVLGAIGSTPAVKLRKVVTRDMADVIIKLEYYNPTGSYKDRMALAMIEGAEVRGALRPGMRVVEYTGGSTGSSLALVCAIKGYPFIAVSSDGFAREKLQTMKLFGTDLRIIPSENGKLTPELFRIMIDTAKKIGEEPNTYYTDQFNNTDAIQGYMGIGNELFDQVGADLAVFCGAVGTAGMLMGVSRALKARGAHAKIIALEPASSPVLTTGKGGPHRVEGTAAGFRPPHLKDGDFDEARAIDEQEGRAMARRLTKEEGIFAGTSSGLNVVAALQLAREFGPGKTVATVAVDSGFKYLAGDLYQT